MTRRTRLLLALLALVSVFSISALWAQTNVSMMMTAQDGSGPIDTIHLAVNTAGTIGIDSLSPTLKEKELPPAPQGFEVRVLTYAGYDNFGPGSYTSIHALTNDLQTDIWKLQYKRDPNATAVDFSWDAGLANNPSLGGDPSEWKIFPDPNDLDDVMETVDMTAQTTLHHVAPDANAHTFFIVKADGKLMRSFTPEEIANAVDSKGKEKGEKRKPYNSSGIFYFVNHYDTTMTDLHITWSQAILDQSCSRLNAAPVNGDGGKNKVWDYGNGNLDSVHPGDTVTIYAHGDKGKVLVAKKWNWTIGGNPFPGKPKEVAVTPSNNGGTGILWLKMPNINNMGEEAYAQTVPIFDPTNGLVAGITTQAGFDSAKGKPFFKAVIHPKWKDVTKTLNAKGVLHVSAAGQICLDNFLTSLKPILKIQKSLPPTKHNNHILAGQIALKLNRAFSILLKTPTGFNDMHYHAAPGDPAGYDGASLSDICATVDSFLSCQVLNVRNATGGQLDTILMRINSAYSGPFDTLSFGNPVGTKTFGTEAAGVKSVYDGGVLYRTSLTSTSFANVRMLESGYYDKPVKYELLQNYPNPFNPTTTIEFNLQADAVVTVKIYNLLGQEVATLANNEQFTEGNNELTWDATNFSSGVYYYRMTVNNGAMSMVKKMMLIK